MKMGQLLFSPHKTLITKGSSRGATLSFTLRSKGEGGQPRYLIFQEIASHFSTPPVKCHPMPSPDDEEGDKFWKKVINRLKSDQGINAMIIYSFVNFDIMKKMYENLTDKKVIVDCGKELNRDGKWDAMAINQTLLALAIDELNDTDKPITSQVRIIEHWWDGIGKWKA